MGAERCAEESSAEDEVRRKGERIEAEESFDKVPEKWELEATAAAERERETSKMSDGQHKCKKKKKRERSGRVRLEASRAGKVRWEGKI